MADQVPIIKCVKSFLNTSISICRNVARVIAIYNNTQDDYPT